MDNNNTKDKHSDDIVALTVEMKFMSKMMDDMGDAMKKVLQTVNEQSAQTLMANEKFITINKEIAKLIKSDESHKVKIRKIEDKILYFTAAGSVVGMIAGFVITKLIP